MKNIVGRIQWLYIPETDVSVCTHARAHTHTYAQRVSFKINLFCEFRVDLKLPVSYMLVIGILHDTLIYSFIFSLTAASSVLTQTLKSGSCAEEC